MRAKDEQKIAKRYARALFDMCEPQNLDSVARALNEFVGIFVESADLKVTLMNPAIAVSVRVSVVGDIGRQLMPNFETFPRFLELVMDNGRIRAIPQISSAFNSLVAALKKMLALEVASAFPLSEAERQDILGAIQKEYGSLTTISWRVDPEILGGLIIRAGDTMIDGTIRGALDRARDVLVGQGI